MESFSASPTANQPTDYITPQKLGLISMLTNGLTRHMFHRGRALLRACFCGFIIRRGIGFISGGGCYYKVVLGNEEFLVGMKEDLCSNPENNGQHYLF